MTERLNIHTRAMQSDEIRDPDPTTEALRERYEQLRNVEHLMPDYAAVRLAVEHAEQVSAALRAEVERLRASYERYIEVVESQMPRIAAMEADLAEARAALEAARKDNENLRLRVIWNDVPAPAQAGQEGTVQRLLLDIIERAAEHGDELPEIVLSERLLGALNREIGGDFGGKPLVVNTFHGRALTSLEAFGSRWARMGKRAAYADAARRARARVVIRATVTQATEADPVMRTLDSLSQEIEALAASPQAGDGQKQRPADPSGSEPRVAPVIPEHGRSLSSAASPRLPSPERTDAELCGGASLSARAVLVEKALTHLDGGEEWTPHAVASFASAHAAELERENADLLNRLHAIIGAANDDDGPPMDEWALEDPLEAVRSLRAERDRAWEEGRDAAADYLDDVHSIELGREIRALGRPFVDGLGGAEKAGDTASRGREGRSVEPVVDLASAPLLPAEGASTPREDAETLERAAEIVGRHKLGRDDDPNLEGVTTLDYLDGLAASLRAAPQATPGTPCEHEWKVGTGDMAGTTWCLKCGSHTPPSVPAAPPHVTYNCLNGAHDFCKSNAERDYVDWCRCECHAADDASVPAAPPAGDEGDVPQEVDALLARAQNELDDYGDAEPWICADPNWHRSEAHRGHFEGERFVMPDLGRCPSCASTHWDLGEGGGLLTQPPASKADALIHRARTALAALRASPSESKESPR